MLGASMRANVAFAEDNCGMSENRGTNSDSQATLALPSQPTPEQLALDLTTPPAAPAPREGEPSTPLDSSTNGTTEGHTTDEIADLGPLITAASTTPSIPTSITAAHATPAPLTVATVGRAWRALVTAVGDLLEHRDGIWALEAGAGTRPLFDLPEDRVHRRGGP